MPNRRRWVIVRRRRIWRLLLVVLVIVGGALAIRTAVRTLYPAAYATAVLGASAQSGVDPRLVWAVMRTESHFRPTATSRSGALGLMQITPTTGEWIAAQRGQPNFTPARLMDPTYNAQTGVWYLAYLIASFGGQLVPALAAYNAGMTPVRQWLTAGRWSGSLVDADRIPYLETRQFVQRVMRSYAIYRYLYAAPGGNEPSGGA